MSLEIIKTAPADSDFTPLSEHQSETPSTFFNAKPVLHLFESNTTLRIAPTQLHDQPAFAALQSSTTESSPNSDALGPDEAGMLAIPHLDIWVSSSNFTIFSKATSHGIEIPYPTICMHAINEGSVYMQLVLARDPQTQAQTDGDDGQDDDVAVLEFHLFPADSPREIPAHKETAEVAHTNGHKRTHDVAETNGDQPTDVSAAARLYEAIAKCSALNPDPQQLDDEQEDEGAILQGAEGMPGQGGWITAENMNDFIDENGQFRMPPTGENGNGEDDEAQAEKYRRTDE